MWKNLRDQWKRNLALKLPAEREWYFQRRINFLADTYEGGVRAHRPLQDVDSPNASPYDERHDEFSYLDDDYAFEGSSLMDDSSPASIREPKSEMRDDGTACGPTLVTVLEEAEKKAATVQPATVQPATVQPATVQPATSLKKNDDTPGISVVSSSTSLNAPPPPPPKRQRTEALNEGEAEDLYHCMTFTIPRHQPQPAAKNLKENRPSNEEPDTAPRLYQRQTPLYRGEAATCAPKQREKIVTLAKALKGGKSVPGDPTQAQAQNGKAPGDKFDKYAAFVSTTLREMPEAEAKRRMREMTMLLFEDIDFND
ncbi:hypothetical protein OSTOST_11474 [Ostertagia ostertagi]